MTLARLTKPRTLIIAAIVVVVALLLLEWMRAAARKRAQMNAGNAGVVLDPSNSSLLDQLFNQMNPGVV